MLILEYNFTLMRGVLSARKDDTPARKQPDFAVSHPSDNAPAHDDSHTLSVSYTHPGIPKFDNQSVHAGIAKYNMAHGTTHDVTTIPLSAGQSAKSLTLRQIDQIGQAQRAYALIKPHHDALEAIAKKYGGKSHSAKYRLTSGVIPHSGHFLASPSVKPDLHLSAFHFPTGQAAVLAADEMRRTMPNIKKTKGYDSSKTKVFEGYRSKDGKFRSLAHKGHVYADVVVPKSFRTQVESLGGKVKLVGGAGGLFLAFATHEAAAKAHAVLSESGHRVAQHGVPGILVVTYVKDGGQAVHESVSAPEVSVADSLIDRIDEVLGCDESFNMSFETLDDAADCAQEMAEAGECAWAVLSTEGGYAVMAYADAQERMDASSEVKLRIVVFPDGDIDTGMHDPVEEAVARRRRLAARMHAGMVKARPMSGARRRIAMTAKRWRLRHRNKHLLNKRTTVYRTASPIKTRK